jgi:RNA polymerase sigma-70 factor (ECF subfamily)
LKIDRAADAEARCGGLTFDELVERYWDSVYRLAYHQTGNVHDAQDLAQETFLKAIAARGSFKVGTNLKAWLLRIGSNAFLDLRRKRKTARASPIEASAEPAVTQRDAAQADETSRAVWAAIRRLDETPRTVFLLRTQDDLSFREIAEVIGTTEDTARWHMMQARRRLMKELDGKV